MEEYNILDKVFEYREEQFLEEFRKRFTRTKTKNKRHQ